LLFFILVAWEFIFKAFLFVLLFYLLFDVLDLLI
jgi:hypothetical protein